MSIEHIKSDVQSVMTFTPQKPKKAESSGFIMTKKIIDREKYSGLRPKLPFFPAIIIPSKICKFYLFTKRLITPCIFTGPLT